MPYRQARFTQEEVQRLLRAARAEDCVVKFGELVIEPRDVTKSRHPGDASNDNHATAAEDAEADARIRGLIGEQED
jgi:hypothetical protein